MSDNDILSEDEMSNGEPIIRFVELQYVCFQSTAIYISIAQVTS